MVLGCNLDKITASKLKLEASIESGNVPLTLEGSPSYAYRYGHALQAGARAFCVLNEAAEKIRHIAGQLPEGSIKYDLEDIADELKRNGAL